MNKQTAPTESIDVILTAHLDDRCRLLFVAAAGGGIRDTLSEQVRLRSP
jgi:hypothetical protein